MMTSRVWRRLLIGFLLFLTRRVNQFPSAHQQIHGIVASGSIHHLVHLMTFVISLLVRRMRKDSCLAFSIVTLSRSLLADGLRLWLLVVHDLVASLWVSLLLRLALWRISAPLILPTQTPLSKLCKKQAVSGSPTPLSRLHRP